MNEEEDELLARYDKIVSHFDHFTKRERDIILSYFEAEVDELNEIRNQKHLELVARDEKAIASGEEKLAKLHKQREIIILKQELARKEKELIDLATIKPVVFEKPELLFKMKDSAFTYKSIKELDELTIGLCEESGELVSSPLFQDNETLREKYRLAFEADKAVKFRLDASRHTKDAKKSKDKIKLNTEAVWLTRNIGGALSENSHGSAFSLGLRTHPQTVVKSREAIGYLFAEYLQAGRHGELKSLIDCYTKLMKRNEYKIIQYMRSYYNFISCVYRIPNNPEELAIFHNLTNKSLIEEQASAEKIRKTLRGSGLLFISQLR